MLLVKDAEILHGKTSCSESGGTILGRLRATGRQSISVPCQDDKEGLQYISISLHPPKSYSSHVNPRSTLPRPARALEHRTLSPRSVPIGDLTEWLPSPVGSTTASRGRPGSINEHCSENPTHPDSPSRSASNAPGRPNGCAPCRRKRNGDLCASLYSTACLTPVCP